MILASISLGICVVMIAVLTAVILSYVNADLHREPTGKALLAILFTNVATFGVWIGKIVEVTV